MTRGFVLLLGALALLSSSCASFSWPPFARSDGLRRGFSLEDLAGELSAFAGRFSAVVNNTADEISDQASRRIVRRRALVWRLQMPPLVDQVAFDDSPLFSYFACLLTAKAQLVYLTEGDGKALFDELQPLAVEAAQNLVNDISAVGDSFLTRSQIAELKQRAEDFAARYPIQGRDFSVQRIPTAVVRAEVVNSLGWLLSLPLAPFTALQGVDSGADAIHDFNRTAQQFVVLARQLPERLRGQMELFVYDLEDRDTVERTVDALDRAATSSERVAATVAGLPEEVRKALLESKQPVEAVAKVVEQANALATPLATAATQLQEASAHWLAILGPNDPTPPDPNKHPFDVRDWQAAASSIGDAAGQLRGLATDVETVQGSNALAAVIDRAFWRAVALIGIFFAALLAYRVLATRFGAPRAP